MKMHIGLHVKYPLLFSSYNKNWDVNIFWSKSPISYSAILELLQVDRYESNGCSFANFVTNGPKRAIETNFEP
jgi:hypothetical protein